MAALAQRRGPIVASGPGHRHPAWPRPSLGQALGLANQRRLRVRVQQARHGPTALTEQASFRLVPITVVDASGSTTVIGEGGSSTPMTPTTTAPPWPPARHMVVVPEDESEQEPPHAHDTATEGGAPAAHLPAAATTAAPEAAAPQHASSPAAEPSHAEGQHAEFQPAPRHADPSSRTSAREESLLQPVGHGPTLAAAAEPQLGPLQQGLAGALEWPPQPRQRAHAAAAAAAAAAVAAPPPVAHPSAAPGKHAREPQRAAAGPAPTLQHAAQLTAPPAAAAQEAHGTLRHHNQPKTRRDWKRRPIRLKPAAACVAVGLAVAFLAPRPEAVTAQAWTLFAIFCTTVTGLVLEPLPVGAWAMCCLTALVGSRAVTFQQAMGAMTNESIWLIVIAFFFAKSFEKTGLGTRIANIFVAAVGHSTLGLSYSLAFAEALVAPAMPSSTARAGGIFMPVIRFLSLAQDSSPTHQRTRLGSFLVHTQFQASAQVAALFMTGAAQNILAMNIASGLGVQIKDVWIEWFKGALVPVLVSLAMIPPMMARMMPPDVAHTPEAPAMARQRLQEMGPCSRDELVTMCTLGVAVVLWVTGEHLGIPAVLGAMVGLASLLLTGVLTWKDCLGYAVAWDTLMWFSVLYSMCSLLSSSGLVCAMSQTVAHALHAANLSWVQCFGFLHVLFFSVHYVFASQVGHVGALYGAFLSMMLASGVPATLAALSLAYNSSLFGAITHYASGPAAVYYGSGYMKLDEVMGTGALMGLRSLVVWGAVGMVWWRLLGWF